MTSFMCVNGFSGVGKSTLLDEFARRHRVRRARRVTTRRLRKGEPPTEYEVVDDAEFDWLLSPIARNGGGAKLLLTAPSRPQAAEEESDILFFTDHLVTEYKVAEDTEFDWPLSPVFTNRLVEVRKKRYRTGIPNPRFWHTEAPDPDVDAVLATFGYASPLIQKYWEGYCISHHLSNPLPMVTVFINMHYKEDLRRRLMERCIQQDINFTEKWRKNLAHWHDPFEEQYDYVIWNDGTIEDCVRQLEVIAGLRPAS